MRQDHDFCSPTCGKKKRYIMTKTVMNLKELSRYARKSDGQTTRRLEACQTEQQQRLGHQEAVGSAEAVVADGRGTQNILASPSHLC